MIIVTVHLASAVDNSVTELARMHICNEGGDEKVGHYGCETFRGRCTEALNTRRVQRSGKVRNHRRLDLHVWHLVGKALSSMGYGGKEPAAPVRCARCDDTGFTDHAGFAMDACPCGSGAGI